LVSLLVVIRRIDVFAARLVFIAVFIFVGISLRGFDIGAAKLQQTPTIMFVSFVCVNLAMRFKDLFKFLQINYF
jgi:hypothetical protein